MKESNRIGFACAYTPVALVHAAGFTPYRILPTGDCPDQASRLLHDNLCPHVRRILDRAMSGDIPELRAMIFMNSCDAMRRVYDAWQKARPDIEAVLIDLPPTSSESAILFFKEEMTRLAGLLAAWGGGEIDSERLAGSIGLYNHLAELFAGLRDAGRAGGLPKASVLLQKCYNKASCEPPEIAKDHLSSILSAADRKSAPPPGVPIYLFGNVLPEPEAFEMIEAAGAWVAGEDLCTGSRLFTDIPLDPGKDILHQYAAGLLMRRPCARTFDEASPGRLSADIVESARSHNASGVVGFTAKFCDPYMARLPNIREALKEAGIPFLFLESDCTLRSIGQQQTRIEAFIEMLG